MDEIGDRGGFRKPKDQTCKTPLVPFESQELVNVIDGGNSRLAWIRRFGEKLSPLKGKVSVDDGRVVLCDHLHRSA